jgi:hypothetical protein
MVLPSCFGHSVPIISGNNIFPDKPRKAIACIPAVICENSHIDFFPVSWIALRVSSIASAFLGADWKAIKSAFGSARYYRAPFCGQRCEQEDMRKFAYHCNSQA